MKYAKCFGLGALALALAAATCLASMPTGPVSAKAGSGGVTVKTFVKLSAAGTIVASSAVTDSVVGVCETTASANGMTSYSPPGARTTVTSGEAIAVGDLLTAGTSGYAFVLDTDDASTQRVCGVALTAADDADQDVTILVVASVVEQHQAITGADLNTPDIDGGTADGLVIGGATAAAVTGTTITGTTITDGTVSLAAGTVTGTFADLGIVTTVDVNGGTIDGVTIGAAAAPTVTNLGSVTTCDINGGSIDGAAIGAATPAAGTFSGLTVSGAGTVTTGSGVVSIAGDMQIAATKYILDASVAGTKTRAGTPITIVFLPTTGETLSWVVPTGYDLLVLNAVGWKTAAAGGDAWDLQNNDGTPANIFAQEAIGGSTLADKAMAQFDDLDDTEWEVEATKSLDLVATEDTDDGGADGIIYVYGILKAHD